MDARENCLSKKIIGAAIEVHSVLGGPGLLESLYEDAMVVELRARGLQVHRQAPCPVTYKGVRLDTSLRVDLVVEDLVIVITNFG